MAITVVGMLLGAIILVLFCSAFAGATVSPNDIAWLAGSTSCGPQESAVYARCLHRHRLHRMIGGLFGACFAVVVGIRWFGSVTIGVGKRSPFADVLFCSLIGVLVGAFSAETYRLRKRSSTTSVASLSPHVVAGKLRLTMIARAFSAAAILTGALVALSGLGVEPFWIAVVGLLIAAIAEATRAAIAGRRRPALSELANGVDRRLREFAASSVTYLQLAAAVLVAGWVLAKIPSGENGALTSLKFVAVLGCVIATIVLLRRAAPRPRRGWR